MAKPEFVLLGVVLCILLSFIGYRLIDNHKLLAMALLMPMRFLFFAPLITGAIPISGITASYVIICIAWYMALSFEIDRCHYYAGGLVLAGIGLHYYGA